MLLLCYVSTLRKMFSSKDNIHQNHFICFRLYLLPSVVPAFLFFWLNEWMKWKRTDTWNVALIPNFLRLEMFLINLLISCHAAPPPLPPSPTRILDNHAFIICLTYRCSSWMQAAQQQSHSCNFSNWKIYELEEAAKAVRHLRTIMGHGVVCYI